MSAALSAEPSSHIIPFQDTIIILHHAKQATLLELGPNCSCLLIMTMLTTNTTSSSYTHLSKEQASSSSSSSLEWKKLPSCSLARQDAASTGVAQDDNVVGLVLIGGRSPDEASLNSVEMFEWSSQRWWTLPSLVNARCGCAITALERTIYVLGGLGASHEQHASCESFTFGQDKEWNTTSILPMPSPRWYAAAVSFPLHQDIVILGGRNDRWQELKTVEAYDLQANEWQSLAPMSTPRFGCGATRIAASKILVAGGFDGSSWLNSAEIYDHETNEWMSAANMPEAMEFCVATTLGEGQYVLVSGKAQKGTPFFVYNIAQDKWTTLETGVNLSGGSMAAVGTKVLTVDGSRHARLSTNLMSLLDDDMTETTSRSSSSHPDIIDFNASLRSEEDISLVPWWASPLTMTTTPKLVIPQHELDLISVLAEDDFGSTIVPSVTSASTRKSTKSSSHKKNRKLVQQIETMDASGCKVLYTGSVSMSHSRPHGKGKMSWVASGDSYKGSFRQGRMGGYGLLQYANGDSFQGIFQKEQRHGRGLYRWKKDGRSYDGNYEHDVPHDPNGTMAWKDGTIYVGAFVQGKRTGKGIQRFPSGVRYQGDFLNGKYEGFGVCEFADFSSYKGHWAKGKAHGQGRLTDANGQVMHDGRWESDGPISN
jgi:hypothetical protein